MFKSLLPYLPALLAALLLNACQNDSAPADQSAAGTSVVDDSPVTLVHNTSIYTANQEQPEATALAFNAQGTIVAVGDSKQLLAQFPYAKIIDLAGRGAVVPGLIDAHGHLMNLGFARLNADLTDTASIAEIIQRLQAKASEVPDGNWLIGRGWDQNDWDNNPDGEFPDKSALDAAFPDRPVWLTRIDGHAGWANSAAMAMTDAAALATDPDGGRIIRDSSGQPGGVFVDAAMGIIGKLIPAPDAATRRQALQLALQQTRRFGLTSVHEAGTSLANLQLYQQLATNPDDFPLRLYAMADGDKQALSWLCKQGVLDNSSARVQARAVKFYLDGALGSRGAALLEPYSDEPEHRGLLFADKTAFSALVERAINCGLQINTHAIGDRANRVLLESYAAAINTADGRNSGRHRIEHAQIMHPDDFTRAAELNLIASMQPTHATSDMYWAEDRVGPDRIKHAYAWQTFRDADVPLALGSDFPVESANPILGFYAAVSRQDIQQWPDNGWYPAQSLTREQALHGFTLGAAYAGFMEDVTGSLEIGKQADFVWLSEDIMTIPAPDIPDTLVLSTWLDGQQIYSSTPN